LSVGGEVFLTCEFAGADLMSENDGFTCSGKAHFNMIVQSG
jgi:hypothetical protein